MQQAIAASEVRDAITKARGPRGAQMRLIGPEEEARRLRRRAFIANRTHEILADRKWSDRLTQTLLETTRGSAAIWDLRRANASNWISTMHRFQTLLTEAAELFAIVEANQIHGGE